MFLDIIDEEIEVIKNKDTRAFIIPQSVSVTKDPEKETSDQIIETQGKFQRLPELIQDKLASDKTGEKIKVLGDTFKLNLSQLSDIARAIRSYYFGEIRLEDFPNILSREMRVDFNTARSISQNVIDTIINDSSFERNYQSQLENTPLNNALNIYPAIGEQLIGSNHIKLKNFPDPVRPSIKNWLSDYTFSLGYEKHDPMARTNYLFKSENGRNLSSQDRERLAMILKSFDEGTSLTINTNTKQIIFSENKGAGFQSAAPDTSISFSSPQKLPYEKLQTPSQPQFQAPAASKPAFSEISPAPQTPQPLRIKPAEKQNYSNFPISTEPEEELPKNVVNLKNQNH